MADGPGAAVAPAGAWTATAGARAAAVLGDAGTLLDPAAVAAFVTEQVAALDLTGRVCVVVPDTTRSCPLPDLLAAVHRALAGRVDALTVLVALGTHPQIPADRLAAWVGAANLPGVRVVQHAWWDPATFVEVGVVPAAELSRLSGGLLAADVPVRVNRAVVDHDALLVVGPVFPHEVVGFSGGDKYFFPGISGPEVIDTSHWLGALITSAAIIGTPGVTPVRALVHTAAALLPCRRACVAVTVASGTSAVHAVAVSEPPESAWAAAAAVSARTHVRYLDRPVRRVLSIVSQRYDEMWTAAKGLYKLEPVVADGGEITLWAPHVRAVSHTFGADIERVGYHCRDWVLAHLDRFPDISRSVLAHCTHARGAGRYDPAGGEQCRYAVTLATGLDSATTDRLAVGWRDPRDLDPTDWAADPDALVVPDAGEVLYRLRG